MTVFKWVAASMLLGCGFLWMGSGSKTLTRSAMADVIPGVDNVQSMTWTTTFYIRQTTEDGKKSWVNTERRLHAYRHPGQYRETMLDEKGQPIQIEITDNRVGRSLSVDLKGKKAVLKAPVNRLDDRGPFAWIGDVIRDRKSGSTDRVKSVSLQGQKEIDKTQANVVRAIIQNVETPSERRMDFLFGVASKQLIGLWIPNEAQLEFETVVDRKNQGEEKWYKWEPIAVLTHEMVLGPKLDPADFSLDPPADYAFEKVAKPTVSEDEMIAYLGAAARFNDNQFPDSPFNAFDSGKFNAASEKKSTARTAVEQAMIDIRDKFMMREIYRSPVKQFEEDQTSPGSFHYVGSGVRIGQVERLVGWYRLRNAKGYRAFYGDLTVKDVTASDLPLNVSNE